MNVIQKKSRRSVVLRKQMGLTLVELMVAMVISLFLLIAIALVYQSSKNGFAYSNNTVRMSEDSSFAIDSLSRDIRMAGYAGCAGLSATNGADGIAKNADDVYIPNLDNVKTLPAFTGAYLPNPFSNNFLNAREALVGYKDAAGAIAAATAAGVAAPGFLGTSTSYALNATAPVLYVSGGSGKAVQVTVAVNAGQPIANIGNDVNKWSNSGSDIFMVIADCKNAEVMRTFGLQASGVITNASNFKLAYTTDAIVTPIESSTYFLARRTGTTGTPATTSSLYRRYFNGKLAVIDEIVPNVEDITFQYGLNTTCVGSATCTSPKTTPTYIADEYVKDSDAKFATMDWSRVVSVRMGLIMVTEDNGQTAKASVVNEEIDWVDGKYKVPTADRRLRRAYSTTVTIRNRGSF
jgi:type IV pilus assembly protein PilW